MKRTMLFVGAAAAALLAGCSLFPIVEGSGVPRTTRYAQTGFTRISASQSFKVHVVPDAVYSVKVTTDDNIVPFLQVQSAGPDTLLIGLTPGNNYRGVTLLAEVHMPSLRGIDFSGATEADIDPGFSSTNGLAITLSGASIAHGSVAFAALTADLSGASALTLSGSVASQSLHVSGASHVDVLGCVSSSADVSLEGASDAKVNVGTGPLTVSASGASTLYYVGSPSLHLRDISGTSRVVKIR